MKKFWMVVRLENTRLYGQVNETGPGPNVRHTVRLNATTQALSLSKKFPGDTFVVLESVDAYKVPTATKGDEILVRNPLECKKTDGKEYGVID